MRAALMFFVLQNRKKLLRDELYVMIMLQRASEGEDKDLCEMCLATGIGADKCEAVCGNEDNGEEDNGKVKSGDLAVTAEAAEGKKVLTSGISDMDTITFKTSENVEISKITLERYGYNSDDSTKIKGIWLEDEDGNIIAESKTLTKDKVTLNIKKDYRKVDGTYVATVVIETDNASKGTIGFKVTDVEHTAKNLNLENYSPYTYEIIDYTGAAVTVEVKGSVKNYNYEEGNSYEVARVKVKANGGKDILVKGFTLTNNLKGEDEKALDMKEFLDELTVTVDSKEVKAKATVNKDDELVVSFSEDVEIAMNKSALFVFSASFKDFDAYGDAVKYEIAKTSDVNAIEKKNETRVTLNIDGAKTGIKHVFAGGKIKLTNKKLGNVDAAQASEGTVIAEGDISVTEPLSKIDFYVNASGNGAKYIDILTMVIGGANGDDFEATKVPVYNFESYGDAACTTKYGNGKAAIDGSSVYVISNSVAGWAGKTYTYKAGTTSGCYVLNGTDPDGKAISNVWVKPVLSTDDVAFHFKSVDVDESGKVQFKVDILDDANIGVGTAKTINFTAFNKSAFDGAKYDNTNKYVQQGDVAGSISFSKVTLQPARASLENTLSTDAEFIQNETNRKTVLEGTYTAKKGGDIDLNKFFIYNASYTANNNKPTFYLYIDDMDTPVADTDYVNTTTKDVNTANTESFTEFRVKAGESVKVKLVAEVEAYDDSTDDLGVFTLFIYGTDMNGNENSGKGEAQTVELQIKAKGSVTIPADSKAKTALLKKTNAEIASFTVKPSKGNDDITLEEVVIKPEIWDDTARKWIDLDPSNIKLNAGTEKDADYAVAATADVDTEANIAEGDIIYALSEEIPSEGVVVDVLLKDKQAAKVRITVKSINKKKFTNVYSKYLVDSIVTIEKWDEKQTITLKVEHEDDGNAINGLTFKNKGGTVLKGDLNDVKDGDTVTFARTTNDEEVYTIEYTVTTSKGDVSVILSKADYPDYFKAGGKEVIIPAKSS